MWADCLSVAFIVAGIYAISYVILKWIFDRNWPEGYEDQFGFHRGKPNKKK